MASNVTITGDDGKKVFVDNTPLVAFREHENTFTSLEFVLNPKVLLYLKSTDFVSSDRTFKFSLSGRNEIGGEKTMIISIQDNGHDTQRINLAKLFPSHVFTETQNKLIKNGLSELSKKVASKHATVDYTGLEPL